MRLTLYIFLSLLHAQSKTKKTSHLYILLLSATLFWPMIFRFITLTLGNTLVSLYLFGGQECNGVVTVPNTNDIHAYNHNVES